MRFAPWLFKEIRDDYLSRGDYSPHSRMARLMVD